MKLQQNLSQQPLCDDNRQCFRIICQGCGIFHLLPEGELTYLDVCIDREDDNQDDTHPACHPNHQDDTDHKIHWNPNQDGQNEYWLPFVSSNQKTERSQNLQNSKWKSPGPCRKEDAKAHIDKAKKEEDKTNYVCFNLQREETKHFFLL